MRSENEHDMAPGARDDGWRDLLLYAWETLPRPVRVQHRLAEILMLLDELQAELADEGAPQLRWIAEEVDVMCESVENVLDRLAN
jgi:hypothetical protein